MKRDQKNIKTEDIEVFHKETHSHRYIADLEEELKEKQEKLKEAYESLEECNDNAQSFNEELISSNEELQSTNEEIQSINEELQTVNNEYQTKIKELAELNDDLNNFFQSTLNSQIYVDRNLAIRKFTLATVKQVNLNDSDLGRPLSDLSTNIKFSTFIEDIEELIESSGVSEKEVQTTDGDWYQMKITPYVRLQDNVTDGVIITFNDVTDLKTLQKKIMKINEDHNTFIYSVSHDLNAPISNISGLISVLNTFIEPGNPKIKEVVGLINASVDKLKETIIELSDITQLEKESSEEIQETVDLNNLLDEVKLSINEMLLKSKAKITTDFLVTEISFSKKSLRSILLNLLTNAIKYKSPERDPEINIRVEKSGNYIILSVADNGRGISKDNKDKLFSKFKRVHEEKNIEGSGIGLYLIKKMIVNAGGKITVESEKGKGSTFIVCFKI